MKRIAQLTLSLGLLFSVAAQSQTYPGFDVTVSPLGTSVNSTGNDYAPFVTGVDNTLYFTSFRNGSEKADVLVTRRNGSEWSTATRADGTFNTDENDGALSVAADGRTVVFASERDGGKGDGDIYIGELVNNQLQNVRNLGANVNTKHWESQPTISGDASTIYFSSNRPGGHGKTDIWMTSRNADGSWSDPVVLGSDINTKDDERSPYLTPDGGTLYFSSNRPDNYGGYDIFMTNHIDTLWTKPQNLGRPINSEEDELFFFAPKAWDRFFVASNRGGLGGYDVFAGTPNIYGNGMFHLHVSLRDSLSGDALSGTVSVIDVESGKTVAFISTAMFGGDYDQPLPAGRNYAVVAQVPGYSNQRMEIASPGANEQRDADFLFSANRVAEFDLGRYNVPFFVTGYYRPNTAQNLENLMHDQNSTLKEATYIERVTRNSKPHKIYQRYAITVDSLFDLVYKSAVNDIFPRFVADSRRDEVIEIVITGYADPQQFVGRYIEDGTHTFMDMRGAMHTVTPGSTIENLELSGLRATYCGELLDEMFKSSVSMGRSEYNRLKSEGRIVYRFIGGGVSENMNDYAVQRRIHIAIMRRQQGRPAHESSPIVFDSNGSGR
jgi:hypothetical protein